MAGPKTGVNTQWGLVSADGTRPIPLSPGDGGEPLISPNGEVWVTLASGVVVNVGDIQNLLRIAGVVPLMQASGRLGVNLTAGDVPLATALGAAGRLAVVLQDAAGNAPVYDALGSARALIAGVTGNLLDVDAQGNAAIRDASPTAVPPAGHASLVSRSFSGGVAVAGHAVVGAAGKKLLRAFGLATTAAQIAMLFDAAALPANGTAPACPGQLINVGSPNQNFMWDFTRTGGFPIVNGVVVAMSTTPGTLTIVGAGSAFIEVEYAD